MQFFIEKIFTSPPESPSPKGEGDFKNIYSPLAPLLEERGKGVGG